MARSGSRCISMIKARYIPYMLVQYLIIVLAQGYRATAMTSFPFHFHMANSNSVAHFVGPSLHFFTK